VRENRVELCARLRERRLRRQFGFAGGVDLRTQRLQAFFQIQDGCFERFAFLRDARDVFGGLRRLTFERFAAGEGRGVVGFHAGHLGALRLSLRAQLLELQFVLVGPRADFRQRRTQRRRLGGRRAAQLFVLFEFDAQRFAFGAARCACTDIGENFEVANARAHLAVALRAAHLGFEFRDAPLDFGDQVADANRVRLRLFETAHRFVLTREELIDAGGLLEERAAIGGFAG
jgi:hypothetical protein